MNSLDKLISWFSPEAGLRRARYRSMLAGQTEAFAYEGARVGRRTAGWLASNTSANQEISTHLSLLRDRSRELIRNNHYALKAQMQYSTRIVGTGITAQWESGYVQERWDQWSSTPECSADGLANLAAIQKLIVDSLFESGEVLIRLRIRRREDDLTVPLQIQVLEADQLDLGKTEPIEGGYILNGVEFNRMGKRIAYWLYREHPGEIVQTTRKFNTESVRVPRFDPLTGIEQVLHIYEPTRPGQVRGVPALHAVMLKMRDLDDFETAETVRKRTEACLVGTVTSLGDSAEAVAPKVTDSQGNVVEQFAPGMFYYGSLGSEIKFNSPQQAGGYEEYKRCAARDIAAGLFMPYELLTGDFSQTNYSNYRGGLLGYRDRIEALQWNLIIPKACDPIGQAFVDMGSMFGDLPAGEYMRTWSPPAFDLLDREAEAKADQLELQVGTKTWPQAVARQGYDPEKQIQEITDWKPRLDAAGVTFAKGAPVNVENQSPAA